MPKRIFAKLMLGVGRVMRGGQVRRSSAGLSILMAVILISLIVVFSIGVTTMVTESTRQAGNVKQGTSAYYAAEAGLEQALLVNRSLSLLSDGGVGANASGGSGSNVAGQPISNFKIQGSSGKLVEQTVNGKYIIPFPWTGNVPWHGEGSIPVVGGCNPEKPPVRTGEGIEKNFTYRNGSSEVTDEEKNHPCNWNKLALGEKAAIPLYGLNSSGDGFTNFTDFILRVRTPCKDGKEMCLPTERLELNCFDKGEIKCVAGDTSITAQNKKGEVVLAWQIDMEEKAGGGVVTVLPLEEVRTDNNTYDVDTSSLFEGRLNKAKTDRANPFVLLDQSKFVASENTFKNVGSFLQNATYQLPALKLSVVGNLVGCKEKTECEFSYDSPMNGNSANNNYQGPIYVPYLEYQVVFPSGGGGITPVNSANIITGEGQSGPFNQTIRVKVPHDSSSLEYVIQQ